MNSFELSFLQFYHKIFARPTMGHQYGPTFFHYFYYISIGLTVEHWLMKSSAFLKENTNT